MNACRCTSLKHPEHPGCVCEKMATEPDGYCRSCHDHHDAATAAPGSGPGHPSGDRARRLRQYR